MEALKNILTEARILPELPALLPPDGECLLVGGALRDWLLEREVTDFDFATPGDPTALAQRFAARTGGKWFILDRERRQSRVVARVQGRSITYDFAPFRAPDLKADLLLRDFTINAMALPLAVEKVPKRLLDPLGGMRDLENRRLRACSSGVFRDDPLRVLKGVRHCATLGFHFEEETFARMREAAGLLGRVAPERVRDELAAIFAAPAASGNLPLLQSLGLDRELFGPAGAQGSLATGVRLAERTEEVARTLSALDRSGWLAGLFAEEIEGGISRLALLKLAAFLRGYDPQTLPDIPAAIRLGRRSTACLLALTGLPRERASEIATLAGGRRGRALWAADLGPDACASLVFLAVLAEGPPAPAAARVLPLLQDVRECVHEGRIPDLVDGRWLREHLGLREGPGIGRALELLRREEVAGRVQSVEEARKFLISLNKKMIDKESAGTL